MFKISSFEQELMSEMSKQLVANQTENKYSYNKIAKAADYLNAAAEILDDTGLHKQAEVATKLLESLAEEGSNDTVEQILNTSIVELDPLTEIEKSFKNLSLEDLEQVEPMLHDAIRFKGGTPIGEKSEASVADVEAPVETIDEEDENGGDENQLRTSKKKV